MPVRFVIGEVWQRIFGLGRENGVWHPPPYLAYNGVMKELLIVRIDRWK